MGKLTINDFRAMLRKALERITERADEFSKLDAALGDGDHGTAIVQAMSVIAESSAKGDTFRQMLEDAGMDVMMRISGSTSTLLGAFFLGMNDAVPEGTAELNPEEVKSMFAGGLAGVRMQTKAQRGDKTMMDALIPAVEAMQATLTDDIAAILEAGAKAAGRGAEDTIRMKANFGRARNYGERSAGYADPGASSWSCMFNAFSEAMK